MWKRNGIKKKVNDLQMYDLVKDEYGNYYTIFSLTQDYRISDVTLCNALWDISKRLSLNSNKWEEEGYESKKFRYVLLEELNQRIEYLMKEGREILSIKDLKKSNVGLNFIQINDNPGDNLYPY